MSLSAAVSAAACLASERASAPTPSPPLAHSSSTFLRFSSSPTFLNRAPTASWLHPLARSPIPRPPSSPWKRYCFAKGCSGIREDVVQSLFLGGDCWEGKICSRVFQRFLEVFLYSIAIWNRFSWGLMSFLSKVNGEEGKIVIIIEYYCASFWFW